MKILMGLLLLAFTWSAGQGTRESDRMEDLRFETSLGISLEYLLGGTTSINPDYRKAQDLRRGNNAVLTFENASHPFTGQTYTLQGRRVTETNLRAPNGSHVLKIRILPEQEGE